MRFEPLEQRQLLSASPVKPEIAAQAAAEYVPGEVLIGFDGAIAAKALAAGRSAALADAAALTAGVGLTEGRVILDQPLGAQAGGRIVTHWHLPAGTSVEAAISKLSTLPGVAYAEPNYVLRLSDVEVQSTFPNDPEFGNLWGLHNTGQSGGTVDADIDAPEAWDISTGSSSVVVGVVDTGIDYTHPDLAANMWTNPGEIPGNGVDDDANGYVDDRFGYDFINNDGDPFDGHSHGTHVSGTIGGVGNNSSGVAGVNWHVQLMALQIFDAAGSTDATAPIEALNYAALMKGRGINLKLTNNSWGGGGFSMALRDAIQANEAADILFVAAAGNNASNNDTAPFYPATYDLPNIISVAATDRNDNLASFSNFGATTVDLGAPGVDVLSTVPGNGYAYFNGTSMASPHVAGIAALAASVAPGASYSTIKDAILAGAVPTGALSGITVTGARGNAFNTLQILSGVDPDVADTIAEAPGLGLSIGGGTATITEPIGNGLYGNLDVDLYSVTAVAGSVLTVETSLPSGGTIMDTYLRIFDSSGTELIHDDDAGPDLYSRIADFVIPSTGIYYVGVSGFSNIGYDPHIVASGTSGSTGSYTLAGTLVVPDPGDDLASAYNTGLVGNGDFTFINPIGNGPFGSADVDLFRLEASAGAVLTAETDYPGIGSFMDTILRVFDGSGTELTYDDDSGNGFYSLINSLVLPSTGTYYVGVSGFPNFSYDPHTGGSGSVGSLGDYGIHLQLVGVASDPYVVSTDPVNDAIVSFGPVFIDVNFSEPMSQDPFNLYPSDLAISGPGAGSVFASAASWLDADTARFHIAGAWSAGQVDLAMISGFPRDVDGNPLVPYTGSFTIVPPPPEIDVRRNSLSIPDGDTTPNTTDGTDFGAPAVGGTVTRQFTILNTGTGPLDLSAGVVLGGANPNDFSVTLQPASSVAPGASTVFNVRFAPTAAGLRSSSVFLLNNDANENPYNFAIQGTGHAALTPAEIDIQGNGLSIPDGDVTPQPADGTDFGNVDVGGFVDHGFVIRNLGTAALLLTGSPRIVISGPHAADFSVVSNPLSPLAANGFASFIVRFAPTAKGSRTAALTISNSDSNENPYHFQLQGSSGAVFPEVDVQRNGISIADGDSTPSTGDGTDFGSVTVGSSITRQFTILNTGASPLNLDPIPDPDGAASVWSITQQPSATVAPGGSTIFRVRFAPTAATSFPDSIDFGNNDTNENPYNFAITGTGTGGAGPEIDVQRSGISIVDGDSTPSSGDGTDFGNVVVGASITRQFTILNTGTTSLTLGTIVDPDGAGTAWSITQQPAGVVAPGGSTTFRVRFSPSASGVSNRSISFSNNDTNENPYNFAIRGTGVSSLVSWPGGGSSSASAAAAESVDALLGRLGSGTVGEDGIEALSEHRRLRKGARAAREAVFGQWR